MVAHVVIAYPNEADLKFDMDYYLNQHMPMVEKTWGPKGLKSWHVAKFDETKKSNYPYAVLATPVWEELDLFNAQLQTEDATKLFGDVPNFSNKDALPLLGNVVGKSSSS